ncbi:MAG TPA: heavy metal-binding domain-containing protein [Acidimicrobiales bacterium]|nr:heavy metal-binding domain-containing protein [Acidimicrobiales bacterium]
MSESRQSVLVSTGFEIHGMTVQRELGVVYGLVVRSMGLVRSIGAGFKSLARGEVGQYTELLEDSRRHALDRMIENAQLMGANAVVAMRFDSSEIGQQLTEIVAYGTAVVVGPSAGPA